MKPFLLTSVGGLALSAAVSLALLAGPAGAEISAPRIGAHVEVLASDAFEGRAPATPAEEKVIAYLSEGSPPLGI